MEVINADEANRNQKQANLDAARAAHSSNMRARGVESTEGMSRKEMKRGGVWDTQKAVNKAQRQFNTANAAFQQTQTAIANLRNNDRATFDRLNTLTYNGRNVNVHVTSNATLQNNQHGAQTLVSYSPELNRVGSVLPGDNNPTLDVLTIRLQTNTNNSDVKLAHESGHIFTFISDPARYIREFQSMDCQDPANRHVRQVEQAMDIQENYLRLRQN